MTIPTDEQLSESELLKRGVDLLCQQIWCWGRDILREEGNWLIELGFDRIEAPDDREKCSSVYTLQLPKGRRVVLRGFGVFYGDDQLGGVFLPRYKFRPGYTTKAVLDCPPWSDAELPKLSPPSESQRDACRTMTFGLIYWIADYEATIAQRLGTDYRQATLEKWSKGKRSGVPATEMSATWRSIGEAIAGGKLALTA